MRRELISSERLRELLEYDPATGVFRRLAKLCNRVKVGQVAGAEDYKGYLQMSVDGAQYRAHRLAWLYMYGTFPSGQIDHIDGNKKNNAISNLRDVQAAINNENRRVAKSDSKTKTLGVGEFNGKWRARIQVRGRSIQIGTFNSIAEASEAYIAAKRRLHEGCAI